MSKGLVQCEAEVEGHAIEDHVDGELLAECFHIRAASLRDTPSAFRAPFRTILEFVLSLLRWGASHGGIPELR
eukprot:10159460-Karenia_brevis.AAC.1